MRRQSRADICVCGCSRVQELAPDDNDLDVGRGVIDDGGGVLVAAAVQDLTVNLEIKTTTLFAFPLSDPLHPRDVPRPS